VKYKLIAFRVEKERFTEEVIPTTWLTRSMFKKHDSDPTANEMRVVGDSMTTLVCGDRTYTCAANSDVQYLQFGRSVRDSDFCIPDAPYLPRYAMRICLFTDGKLTVKAAGFEKLATGGYQMVLPATCKRVDRSSALDFSTTNPVQYFPNWKRDAPSVGDTIPRECLDNVLNVSVKGRMYDMRGNLQNTESAVGSVGTSMYMCGNIAFFITKIL
jgi:hypothetical protein